MSHASLLSEGTIPFPQFAGRAGVKAFTTENLGILNHLRIAALNCRCARRAELSEACRALSEDPVVSASAFSEALVRCLPQVFGRAVRFFSPGVTETSSEEAWLLRLIVSLRDGDDASAEFLLRSRVPGHMRQSVLFLARGVAC